MDRHLNQIVFPNLTTGFHPVPLVLHRNYVRIPDESLPGPNDINWMPGASCDQREFCRRYGAQVYDLVPRGGCLFMIYWYKHASGDSTEFLVPCLMDQEQFPG